MQSLQQQLSGTRAKLGKLAEARQELLLAAKDLKAAYPAVATPSTSTIGGTFAGSLDDAIPEGDAEFKRLGRTFDKLKVCRPAPKVLFGICWEASLVRVWASEMMTLLL